MHRNETYKKLAKSRLNEVKDWSTYFGYVYLCYYRAPTSNKINLRGITMKKLFFILVAVFSASIVAQDEMKHEPVANKAEYYIGSFNDRKDMDDLMKWASNHQDWLNGSELYDSMATSILVPYFINDTSRHDVVWLNIWPSSTEQYAGLENWLKNGGSQLSKLPITNSQVVDTWQWAVSEPEGEGSVGMVRYSDCKLKDGVTGLEAFNEIKEFAIAARAKGDNLGRKMIFPSAGGTEGDYDYVYALYANNASELGSGADLYWDKINGSEEDLALNEVIDSCSNYRTYSSMQIRTAK